MSTSLITNIAELTTNVGSSDGDRFGTLVEAAVLIDGERIAWVGSADDAPVSYTHLTLPTKA